VLARRPLNHPDSRVIELRGDLQGLAAFRGELLASDYVFHLAANAAFDSDCDYESVNYQPTVELAAILKQSRRLRGLVFVSTIGAVDRAPQDNCAKPLDAESRPSPRSSYGASKLKAEQAVRESGLPWTIIRPTWVYGADMRTGSHINRFVTMAADRHPIVRLAFPGRVSLIHVRDLARALTRCIDNPAAVGRAYFAVTESLSIGRIFALISEKIAGKRPAQIPVPSFAPFIGRLHARLPLTLANLFVGYLWAEDARFREDFKLSAPILFEAGVADVIRTNVRLSGCWVITGANSGIGLALAKRLAGAGKQLALIDKDTDQLGQFKNAQVVRADLAEAAGLEAVSAALAGVKIAGLVNNAGIGVRGPQRFTPPEAMRRILAVNALAPVLLTRHLIENLVANEAVIVNIASSIAYNPLPFMALYSATKALLSNWSESLAYELRRTNLVITFSPAGTLTGFQRAAGVKVYREGKGLLTPDYVAGEIIRAIRRRKKVVILGLPTRILLFISRFLPRGINILFWGKLFEKYR
jgi:short-subunit dehydrogenase